MDSPQWNRPLQRLTLRQALSTSCVRVFLVESSPFSSLVCTLPHYQVGIIHYYTFATSSVSELHHEKDPVLHCQETLVCEEVDPGGSLSV